MNATEKIYNLIENGKIEDAISELITYTQSVDAELHREAIALSGQYKIWHRERRLDIGAKSETLNRIEWAILSIAKDLNALSIAESELKILKNNNVNYQELINLLKKQDFKAADNLTDAIMKSIKDTSQKGLTIEEMKNFPCEELKDLDNIWSFYTKGRYSFSVQLRILIECEYNEDKFASAIGWKRNGLWIAWSDANFNKLSPRGHLPICGKTGGLNIISAHTMGQGIGGLVIAQTEVMRSGIGDIFEEGGFQRFRQRFIREFGYDGGNGFAIWWMKGRIPLLNCLKNCSSY